MQSLRGFKTILCIIPSFLSLFVPSGSDPVLLDLPFVTVWNAPTRPCLERFGVEIDLDVFDIVMNQNHSFLGDQVVIFYSNQLGHYPHYDQDTKPVNGGLPQNASLEEHLMKARQDLEATISGKNFKGVAVVDWENWQPLWNRNWKQRMLYKLRSLELVHQKHPELPFRKAVKKARMEFEDASQKFMKSTLELAQRLNPNGLWGFYGFPNCFNYEYKDSSYNYTGMCPVSEKRRNDLLTWLWRASRALYPDIYLEKQLKKSKHVRCFVKHRVEEGFRVAKVAPGVDLPVLPYARIVYTYSMDFLTQGDLIQTLGQSAALGAAGIILWGNTDYSASKESCLAVKSYVHETLGKYVKNVTRAAILCSQSRCAGHGRCVRKDPSSDAHLHLDPKIFTITNNPLKEGLIVDNATSNGNLSQTWTQFQCRCYKAWRGTNCTEGANTTQHI
ncbi:hyaluronidase-1-like [Spea bombifrons]|uniref:hyaluronidase-1-like n=1 Tax=Spea bombifrons TaxID=233779 RepID=UPI002349E73E|nr:hyaluronidase-1-like [Spea bombifrons]